MSKKGDLANDSIFLRLELRRTDEKANPNSGHNHRCVREKGTRTKELRGEERGGGAGANRAVRRDTQKRSCDVGRKLHFLRKGVSRA